MPFRNFLPNLCSHLFGERHSTAVSLFISNSDCTYIWQIPRKQATSKTKYGTLHSAKRERTWKAHCQWSTGWQHSQKPLIFRKEITVCFAAYILYETWQHVWCLVQSACTVRKWHGHATWICKDTCRSRWSPGNFASCSSNDKAAAHVK